MNVATAVIALFVLAVFAYAARGSDREHRKLALALFALLSAAGYVGLRQGWVDVGLVLMAFSGLAVWAHAAKREDRADKIALFVLIEFFFVGAYLGAGPGDSDYNFRP